MSMDLFSQFNSPILFWIPLSIIATSFPILLVYTIYTRWVNSRTFTVQMVWMKQFTIQIMSPLNTPGHKWALLLTALMVLLLQLNSLGLLPYTFAATAHLSTNLGLAVPLWLATVIIGFKSNPTHALGHLLPEGTPTPLIPILIIIETVSLMIRPLALGVRLTANLTAGHLLMQLITTATVKLLFLAPPAVVLMWTLLAILTVLEMAVAIIQAYVFVLLLSLYLQENV